MATSLTKRFTRAARQVETFLQAQSPTLSALPKGEFPQGWAAELKLPGKAITLQVLLPRDFPSVPPRIRVVPPEQYYLHIPHVEEDGLLCIYPAGVEFNTNDATAGIATTWARARDLLEKPNLDDFFEEFPSYWRRNVGARREVLSLFADEAPVKSYALIGSDTIVIGETEATVKQWWKNYKGDPKQMPLATVVGRLDLAKPLYPSQFPRTLADFLALVQSQYPQRACEYLDIVAQGSQSALVIVRIPSPRGWVEAVVELPALSLAGRVSVRKGFRAGRVPLPIVQSRGQAILRQTALARFTLQPIFHRYIHSRGGNGTDLAQKSVIVVGCGSLGGYVAHLLAKAGVGRLILIDQELLGWDNAGRHILGGRFVGLSKARSLAHLLHLDMPHLKVEAFAFSWRDVHDFQSLAFCSADLIVSTVGSWAAEHDLNQLLRGDDLPSAGLFTWIEPHAVAGHSILVHPTQGGCMECLMDSWGTFAGRTCDPKPLVQSPGCAGFFQPYGVAEMIPTASMAVQQGIDYLTGNITASQRRTWLGAEGLYRKHGLTPISCWAEKLILQPFGSIHHEALAPAIACNCCH